jgi:hypothetical protein
MYLVFQLAEVEPLQDDPALEEDSCEALLCRLRFRKALYHTLVYMDKPLGRRLEMAQKPIVRALAEVSAIRASSKFLFSNRERTEPIDIASTASGQPAIGFDESVNGRILAPTPPRSMSLLLIVMSLVLDIELFSAIT